jgi:hypothetical protein
MVALHYPELGFTPIEGSPTAQWVLDLKNYQPRECFIVANE